MSTEPRNIREVFREHEEENFSWFCYNPNLSDMADEIKELLAAHDALEQKLAVAIDKFERIALYKAFNGDTWPADIAKEALALIKPERGDV